MKNLNLGIIEILDIELYAYEEALTAMHRGYGMSPEY